LNNLSSGIVNPFEQIEQICRIENSANCFTSSGTF